MMRRGVRFPRGVDGGGIIVRLFPRGLWRLFCCDCILFVRKWRMLLLLLIWIALFECENGVFSNLMWQVNGGGGRVLLILRMLVVY